MTDRTEGDSLDFAIRAAIRAEAILAEDDQAVHCPHCGERCTGGDASVGLWHCGGCDAWLHAPTWRCPGCGEASLEVWVVHDELWAAAGLQPDDGLWCRPCFERLIGRRLAYEDFEPDPPCNGWFLEWIAPAAQLALFEVALA